MIVVVLVVAVLALAALVFLLAWLRRLISRHGAVTVLWRFLSGQALDGVHRTNATFTMASRGARPVLHPTGHARRWHHRPGWHRTVIRLGALLGAAGIAAGIILAPLATGIILAVMAAVGVFDLAWRVIRWVHRYRHYRAWVRPLHRALVPTLGAPPARLEIEPDRSKVLVGLPEEFTPSDRDKDEIVRAVTTKLAIQDPVVDWSKLHGAKPQVTFTPCAEPPPRLVTWDEVAGDVARLKPDELLVGLGKKRQLVTVSLKDDSPHFLISMGTGAGKSTTAAFWVVQALMRGDIVLFLDPKQHSHPWAFKDMNAEFDQLPNIAYVRRVSDLHAAMAWLGNELDSRNRIATMGMNSKGDVIKGDVGPRIFVICEEVNLAEGPLKQYWAENRDPDVDPKKSPAFTGLGAVAFAGRAVKMHLVVIGQMVTANVLGGGSVRENMGVRCLARYTQNSWKMQAGDIPMPPPPSVIGRIQCIASGEVREAQVPYVDIEENTSRLRELAMSGIVTPCPPGMPGAAPGRELVGATVPSDHTPIDSGPDQGLSLGHVPPSMTLPEAVKQGIFGDRKYDAVRKAMQRAENIPDPIRRGSQGVPHEWAVEDLYAMARELERR